MKILIILATGIIVTFPMDERVKPDCFSQGYSITQNISTYHGPEEKGEDQGWVLKDSKVQVAGWYCQ